MTTTYILTKKIRLSMTETIPNINKSYDNNKNNNINNTNIIIKYNKATSNDNNNNGLSHIKIILTTITNLKKLLSIIIIWD